MATKQLSTADSAMQNESSAALSAENVCKMHSTMCDNFVAKLNSTQVCLCVYCMSIYSLLSFVQKSINFIRSLENILLFHGLDCYIWALRVLLPSCKCKDRSFVTSFLYAEVLALTVL